MQKIFSKDSVHRLAVILSILFFIIVLGLGGVQAYVRWAINQNFTFLGGFELEAITIGVFVLLSALLLTLRRD
jgi:hypothetical protein